MVFCVPCVRLCTCSEIALTDGFDPNLHLKGRERVGVGVGCLRGHGTGGVARDHRNWVWSFTPNLGL